MQVRQFSATLGGSGAAGFSSGCGAGTSYFFRIISSVISTFETRILSRFESAGVWAAGRWGGVFGFAMMFIFLVLV